MKRYTLALCFFFYEMGWPELCLFNLLLLSTVNSWDHVGTVSYPSNPVTGMPPRGSLLVLCILSFAINWLLFLNQWNKKNGSKNIFMAKFSWKNVSDMEINLGTSCILSCIAKIQATELSGCLISLDGQFQIVFNDGILCCHLVFSQVTI